MSASIALDLPRKAAAPSMIRLWRIFIAIGLLAVALPALLVEMPPLLDYPNHVVRMWLLGGAVKDPILSQMYATDWTAAWTNVGVDLVAQLAGQILPITVVAPLLLAVALVMPPIGAILLNQRLYGKFHWWQVVMPLTAFATPLLGGFLNFQTGIGLALAFASLDPWLEKRGSPVQLLIGRMLMATILLVVHIFAVGFYGLLLGGLALGPNLMAVFQRGGLKPTFARLAGVAAGVVGPLLIYRLTAPHLPGGGGLGEMIWGPTTLRYKLELLQSAFGTYDLRIDRAFFAVPLVLLVLAAFLRSLRVHQGLLVGAVFMVVLALVSPTWAAETGWIDTRMPIMALLIFMVAVSPDIARKPKLWIPVAALMLGLVVARAWWIGDIWVQRQADVRSIERAMSRVPAGSAVLPVDHLVSVRGKRIAPPGRFFHFGASYYHQYTLAVMERKAFSPLVFSMHGKQPIKVLEPWKRISVPNGGRSPTFATINSPNAKWLNEIAPYIKRWRQDFDYALMLNADVLEDVNKERVPEGMTLVADEGFARLYKIDRKPPPET
jgi:hypothetical protein